MVAIFTEFVGATETLPSRIAVYTSNSKRRELMHYDQAVPFDEMCCQVAMDYASSKGWKGGWIGGGTKKGMVWVCVEEEGFSFTV